MITLKYRKRKRYLNLLLAILWILILIFRLIQRRQIETLDFWIGGFALFFLIYFIYLSKKPLLSLSKLHITRHRLFGKTVIPLNELTELEINAKGDYVLKSNTGKEISFKPVYLDQKSLKTFKAYISDLSSGRDTQRP